MQGGRCFKTVIEKYLPRWQIRGASRNGCVSAHAVNEKLGKEIFDCAKVDGGGVSGVFWKMG